MHETKVHDVHYGLYNHVILFLIVTTTCVCTIFVKLCVDISIDSSTIMYCEHHINWLWEHHHLYLPNK